MYADVWDVGPVGPMVRMLAVRQAPHGIYRTPTYIYAAVNNRVFSSSSSRTRREYVCSLCLCLVVWSSVFAALPLPLARGGQFLWLHQPDRLSPPVNV